MAEEKIIIQAKRKRKIGKLTGLLRELGFTNVKTIGNDIVAEKLLGESLSSKQALLDYRIIFGKNNIELQFSIPQKESRKKRMLTLFPIFLNAALLAEDEYEIRVSTIFNQVNVFLSDVSKVIDKDTVDLASELSELKTKYDDLSKKYAELVRSSEENARLLLECERRRDELHQRTHNLEKLSDEALKEELYKWVKIHEGTINLEEFCKAYNMPTKRAEEGLELLVREGYIKKRAE